MELRKKLSILADAAKYDASCASSGSKRERGKGGLGNTNGMGICHSYAPDGRCISLLKILLTNYCVYDCQFCINRVSSSVPRARFTPEEVVTLTVDFYKRNYIEGLFLSSGIIRSVDYTMEQLVQVAKSLRNDHLFGGYIHLKAIAGAAPELLEEAGRYADRLSANIELPTQADLDLLAPAKRQTVIESSMNTLKSRIDAAADRTATGRAPRFTPAGQTTQLIVGATPATDLDILSKAEALYNRHTLRRVYYSAFSPIPDSAPGVPATPAPLMREHRLYQADWLQRFYGFELNELLTAEAPSLSLDRDPKLSWALANRGGFPIDVNRAERRELLRVPGFGVRTVDRILRARRFGKLRLTDLARMRVPLKRSKFFIETEDFNVAARRLERIALPELVAPSRKRSPLESDGAVQLSLFEAGVSALSGEL